MSDHRREPSEQESGVLRIRPMGTGGDLSQNRIQIATKSLPEPSLGPCDQCGRPNSKDLCCTQSELSVPHASSDEAIDAMIRERDELRAEVLRERAEYNDLIGRIPRYMLDGINKGEHPHVCEFRSEFDAMKARAETAEGDLRRYMLAAATALEYIQEGSSMRAETELRKLDD